MVKRALCLLLWIGCLWPLAAGRVRLQNGSLTLGQERFVIRGVAYSNVPIGQWPGSSLPSIPCLFARDLPLVAALGANTLRTYALLPEGDNVFVPLLESAGLYWLAGFPLDRFYDPSRTITSQKERILQAFRDYAGRFRGQARLIGYVFGNEVARDYNRKLAGSPAEFYALLEDAAGILRELEPEETPLLTTAVSDLSELTRQPSGLSFWSWNACPGVSFFGLLEEARRRATRPVLISEYGVDAFDQRIRQENELAQAEATLTLTREIQLASWLLGSVYASFVDEWWRGGDPNLHLAGGATHSGFPDGFRNEAWFGIFRATATEQPGLDSLRPRAVFVALAGLWGGRSPAAWKEPESPRLSVLVNAASGVESASPGALVRLTGKSLLELASSYADDAWPFQMAGTCLCVGGSPARLGSVSPEELSAQIPWEAEVGDRKAVFFRAGLASNVLPVRLRLYAPGIFSGAVLRAGLGCSVSVQNGARAGEALEVYATGLGPPGGVPEALLNSVPARVLYAGLLAGAVGIHQVNIVVPPDMAPVLSAGLELRVGGTSSNLYPLSIAGPADRPAVALRCSQTEILLQAGGEWRSVEVDVEGVNGFCGAVFFEALNLPEGISFRIPVGMVGRRVPLAVRAAAGTPALENRSFRLMGYGGGVSSSELALRLTVLPSQGDIPVRVISGGYRSTPLARFDWNNRTLFSTIGGGPGRGINVLSVDPMTGVLSAVSSFDTWGDEKASTALVTYLSSLPNGTVALFAVADEASYRLSQAAKAAIAIWFGSRYIQQLGYQHSWALIGRKGFSAPIAEAAQPDRQVVLERILTLPTP